MFGREISDGPKLGLALSCVEVSNSSVRQPKGLGNGGDIGRLYQKLGSILCVVLALNRNEVEFFDRFGRVKVVLADHAQAIGAIWTGDGSLRLRHREQVFGSEQVVLKRVSSIIVAMSNAHERACPQKSA